MSNDAVKRIFDWTEENKVITIIITLVFLAAILYPRFNMQDTAFIRPFTGVAPGEMPPDQKNYYNFTEYFKGRKELNTVSEPFTYRPLLPFIASLLPFDAMLSMSIVNTLANLFTLLLIYLILKELQFSFALRAAGLLLYIISFPLLYYGSSGFLEPTANLFIYLIVYLTLSQRMILLIPAFILASAAKEVSIIALPFALSYFWMIYRHDKNKLKKSMTILTVSFIMFVLTNIIIRNHFDTGNSYIWSPTFETAIGNLKRAKTYLSFLLGFGFPGIFSMLYLVKYKEKVLSPEILPWFIGMIFAIMLSVYSVIAAYSDGRFIWTGYPFMITLSIYYLQKKFANTTN